MSGNKNNQPKGQTMYIGKVELKETWKKLEDLIQEQISGQSGFAFDETKTYSLQTDTGNDTCVSGAYVCNSATEPTELNDGEHLDPEISAEYVPESGIYLWVKIRGAKHDVRLAISEI